jgi:ketosteroid isomerase-like protein
MERRGRYGGGLASGVQLRQMRSSNASVHHIKDGKVIKLMLYWDSDRALTDLGLAAEVESSD